jgi:hypothetical protein
MDDLVLQYAAQNRVRSENAKSGLFSSGHESSFLEITHRCMSDRKGIQKRSFAIQALGKVRFAILTEMSGNSLKTTGM